MLGDIQFSYKIYLLKKMDQSISIKKIHFGLFDRHISQLLLPEIDYLYFLRDSSS